MDSKNPVLKTLVYSDIFDFPLKKEEIWIYLISNKKISKKDFLLSFNEKRIVSKNNFYFLKGKSKNIKEREKRNKESLIKIKKARKIAKLISFIPSVYFIGITGSLALLSSRRKEDIDIFIITSKNTIWITRLFAILLLKTLGVYRKRAEKDVKDKICLNMIIGENKLSLEKNKQDLYSAHEAVQMLPIFERNKTYTKFLRKNSWIKKFLPNALLSKKKIEVPKRNIKMWQINMLRLLEPIARKAQYSFMKKNITIETVTKDFLAFHAVDYRSKILNKFNKKIKKYE
ncbi:MAG: hypothetical protein V1697_01170 [Candidatus Levyibacteriota bacterium]